MQASGDVAAPRMKMRDQPSAHADILRNRVHKSSAARRNSPERALRISPHFSIVSLQAFTATSRVPATGTHTSTLAMLTAVDDDVMRMVSGMMSQADAAALASASRQMAATMQRVVLGPQLQAAQLKLELELASAARDPDNPDVPAQSMSSLRALKHAGWQDLALSLADVRLVAWWCLPGRQLQGLKTMQLGPSFVRKHAGARTLDWPSCLSLTLCWVEPLCAQFPSRNSLAMAAPTSFAAESATV
jgi:hypothetical protein